MKKLLTIIIFISLLLQCFAHYGIVALYELRKDYIARNLCENRDKPALKCCGKCYLRKQLNKVEDNNDNSSNAPLKIEKWDPFICVLPQPMVLLQAFVACTNKAFNPGQQDMAGYDPIHSIFHPPIMV